MAEQKNIVKQVKGKKPKKSNGKNPKRANKPVPADKHEAYKSRDKYPERMLRRVCVSSGYRSAEEYAMRFGLLGIFQELQLTPFFQQKLEEARRKEDLNYVPTKQRLEAEKAQAEAKRQAESDTGCNC